MRRWTGIQILILSCRKFGKFVLYMCANDNQMSRICFQTPCKTPQDSKYFIRNIGSQASKKCPAKFLQYFKMVCNRTYLKLWYSFRTIYFLMYILFYMMCYQMIIITVLLHHQFQSSSVTELHKDRTSCIQSLDWTDGVYY